MTGRCCMFDYVFKGGSLLGRNCSGVRDVLIRSVMSWKAVCKYGQTEMHYLYSPKHSMLLHPVSKMSMVNCCLEPNLFHRVWSLKPIVNLSMSRNTGWSSSKGKIQAWRVTEGDQLLILAREEAATIKVSSEKYWHNRKLLLNLAIFAAIFSSKGQLTSSWTLQGLVKIGDG